MASAAASDAENAQAADEHAWLFKWERRTAIQLRQECCPLAQELAEIYQGLIQEAEDESFEPDQGELHVRPSFSAIFMRAMLV